MLGKSEIVFVRGSAEITHSGAEVNQDWFLYPTLGLLFSKSTCLYGTDKI